MSRLSTKLDSNPEKISNRVTENPTSASLRRSSERLFRLFGRLQQFLSLPSLQSKLTVPYALLTLVLTIVGIFILTRLVTSSIRERFTNQLYEAGRVASDGIVLQEKKHLEALRMMLKNGNYVGIATHDDYLIENSYKMIKEMNIPKDKFEFQMLLGVKEELRDRINSDGYKVRIYVPFGEDWFAYSIRRLKENPQIAGYVFKNIFSFGK